MNLIPCTILTGFLGAGKTTLLNHILKGNHQHRIAVIENEFGPENIDGAILVQDSAEQIIEMSNGCICCTIRGDLVETLSSLAQKRADGQIHFDRIVIETTGLAEPGPIAQTFFMDDAVAKHYLLDGVVTVVDALHGMRQLDAHEQARAQAGFADKILLSKTDLVDPQHVTALRSRLVRMNPRAKIIATPFGQTPLEEILDLRGFHLNDRIDIAVALQPTHTAHETQAACTCADCGHPHHSHTHQHPHPFPLDDIAAFSFVSERPFQMERLEEFLQSMVQVYGDQMLRYKGVLYIDGAPVKVVFQGIYQLMGSDVGAAWQKGEPRASKMVFIGKNLPENVFLRGLEQCLL